MISPDSGGINNKVFIYGILENILSMKGTKTMTNYFENLFNEIQEQKKSGYFNTHDIMHMNIMHMDISLFQELPKSTRDTILNSLSTHLQGILPLHERIALTNYAGYFNNDMGDYDFIVLHISKLQEYIDISEYENISEMIADNFIQVNTDINTYAEYFVFDGYSDTITFYDTENISKYINDIMPGTIEIIIDRNIDEDISVGDLLKKAINETLTEKLMR